MEYIHKKIMLSAKMNSIRSFKDEKGCILEKVYANIQTRHFNDTAKIIDTPQLFISSKTKVKSTQLHSVQAGKEI